LKKKGIMGDKKRKKETERPPQKLFNPNDVEYAVKVFILIVIYS